MNGTAKIHIKMVNGDGYKIVPAVSQGNSSTSDNMVSENKVYRILGTESITTVSELGKDIMAAMSHGDILILASESSEVVINASHIVSAEIILG